MKDLGISKDDLLSFVYKQCLTNHSQNLANAILLDAMKVMGGSE